MKQTVIAVGAAAALAAGAGLAVVRRSATAQHAPPVVPPGDESLVTDLTTVALGQRRAVEFLRADALDSALLGAASRAASSVVRVSCRAKVRLSGATAGETGSADWHSNGSGFVVAGGRVLTAAHVLWHKGLSERTTYTDERLTVLLADGTEMPATVLARGSMGAPVGGLDADATSADWVLLAVDNESALPPPLSLGAPQAGRSVVTLGYGGLVGLRDGGRAFRNESGEAGSPQWSVGRVTDASFVKIEPLAGCCPLQGGASGGPVVDASGRVVAIHTGDEWEEIGFDAADSRTGRHLGDLRRVYTLRAASVAEAAKAVAAPADRPR